jgi:FAD/FMN-containing dehydrogenase
VSADDVATTIKTLNVGGENCRFAIRSGGHMMNAGAANIADGVTIDLRGLDFVELDKDDNVVSIGPGATWREVYAKLDPLGLSTTGGRTASVGVGGLTVGGGISYFAPQKGWVCDNVRNFEVVLANGSIVNANKDENPDLLVALRGGANNFGVVTRLDLEVFEHGLMLGGQLIHDISVVPDQIDAFVQVNRADYDEHASLVAAWAYTPLIGVFAITHPVYTKPVQRPKVYEKIFSLPTLSSTVRITNLSNLTNELEAQQPPGSRSVAMLKFFMLMY